MCWTIIFPSADICPLPPSHRDLSISMAVFSLANWYYHLGSKRFFGKNTISWGAKTFCCCFFFYLSLIFICRRWCSAHICLLQIVSAKEKCSVLQPLNQQPVRSTAGDKMCFLVTRYIPVQRVKSPHYRPDQSFKKWHHTMMTAK